MTKTISLADDAYEVLAAARREGESFSDVARRLARLAAQDEIFRPVEEPPVWTDAEARALKRRIYRARKESTKPRSRL